VGAGVDGDGVAGGVEGGVGVVIAIVVVVVVVVTYGSPFTGEDEATFLMCSAAARLTMSREVMLWCRRLLLFRLDRTVMVGW